MKIPELLSELKDIYRCQAWIDVLGQIAQGLDIGSSLLTVNFDNGSSTLVADIGSLMIGSMFRNRLE
ncbi:MAG: hypothetical protein LBE64_15955 [Acinetobacter pittii]|jgi:hypothetical protein|nr:hypothetical protein [Acinetobacter pittii]